jgi:hypothetical protein
MWSVHTFQYFMRTIYITFPTFPRNSVCKLFTIVSSTKQNTHTYIKNLRTYDWRENKLNLSNSVYWSEISESAFLRLICILRKSPTYLASNMGSKSCRTTSELASALCHVSWLVTILSILWMNTWASDSANCSSTQIVKCCGLIGGYYCMLWQPIVAHFAGGKYGHIVTAQVNLGLTDTPLEHHAFYCFNLTGVDSVKPTWKKSNLVLYKPQPSVIGRVCSYLWNYREVLTTTIWR